MPAGRATVTGSSSRSSTVRVWWEMPRWRSRSSLEDMRATSSVGAAERERHVGGVERRHAAVPERRAGADDPGAGPANRRVPAQLAEAVMQRARRADRLGLAAVGGARSYVPGEQAPPAQLADGARVPTRKRPALGLDVSEPLRPGGLAGEGPRQRGKLAVQGEHGHRPPHGSSQVARRPRASTACCRLV